MRKPTDRDMDTLGDLIAAYDAKYGGGRGQRPMDFGGSNGSHHSATATKLVKYGYAEHTKGTEWGQASTKFRGSKRYRPTDAGRLAHAEWAAFQSNSVAASLEWLIQALDKPNHPLIERAKAILAEHPMSRDELRDRRSRINQVAAEIVDTGSVDLGFPPMARLEEVLAAI